MSTVMSGKEKEKGIPVKTEISFVYVAVPVPPKGVPQGAREGGMNYHL
jgi:hypothetical protein